MVLLYIVGYSLLGCPIRRITGIPCPACGLTRASLLALVGDFSAAFSMHPLFFLPYLIIAAALLWLCLSKEKQKRLSPWLLAFLLLSAVLFLALWLFRLFGGGIQ